jgi:hypothetical protein
MLLLQKIPIQPQCVISQPSSTSTKVNPNTSTKYVFLHFSHKTNYWPKLSKPTNLQHSKTMARAATSLTLAAVIALAISTHAFTSLPQPNVNANAKYHATKLYGSGGMDAYAAQMAAMMGNAPPASNSEPPSAAAAPVAAQPAPAAASFSGGASASAAVSSMAASQASVLSQIAASIPDLAPKPDLSYDASSGFTVNGRTVSLDARDAPGPANIAWISSLCVDDALSSLTIFNGPLTDVPHLISRCAIRDDGQMHFFLDFRPRAYGAYDLRNADGSYPGPETLGRKSFEYSGARKDFDGKFGNEEVVQFLNGVMSQLEGAVRSGEDMTTLNELEKVTRGPLAMDLIVPLR